MTAVQFLPLMLFGTYAVWHGAPTDERWVANLYLLAGGLAAFAQQWWFLRYYGALRESAIFLFMLGVGVVATFGTAAGFLAVAGAPAEKVRRHSLVMLAATTAALAVSVVFQGHTQVSTGLPVLGLTVVQRGLRSL